MNKRNILYRIIIMMPIVLFCLPVNADSVTWHSFNRGYSLAKSLKRPVVIDFYADWCRWCRVMDKEVFSDPAVSAFMNKYYVCIRVKTDSPEDIIRYGKHVLSPGEFSSMMGVSGLPTLVFMDKNGEPVTKVPGYTKKEVFLPLLRYMRDECYRKNITFDQYMTGKTGCAKGD